jgi:hypothetical protein
MSDITKSIKKITHIKAINDVIDNCELVRIAGIHFHAEFVKEMVQELKDKMEEIIIKS